MKRFWCLMAFLFLAALQTGCQSMPFGQLSQMSLGRSNGGYQQTTAKTAENELAAYQQSMPDPQKEINRVPGRSIPMMSRPLGYRRGYQSCNT